MSQDLSPDDAYKLLKTLKNKTLSAQVTAAARKAGVREDALDLVIERAQAAFDMNANGDLRGPNGLTVEGWTRFILPTEAAHVFEPEPSAPSSTTDSPTMAPSRRETARDRLGRANGDLPTAGFQ